MVYPGSIFSLLMDNSEASHFFSNLPPTQQQSILSIEFKSSQELYDYITNLKNGVK